MAEIDYESEGFPAGAPVANGPGRLAVSWDDILWSALTVGRPNRSAVFQHGDSSLFEAIFRLSLVRMALEQAGPRATRLRRTDAARTLDPTEKGAVNYFIGMTVCKMFADRLLAAPWMLHLDVFRPLLNPVLTGRSRPDLIGQRTPSGQWIVLECKGRISVPSSAARTKAKQQALRCVSVSGSPAQFHIGGIAYLKKDVLQFHWRDPKPQRNEGGVPIEIDFDTDLWRYHYALVLALIKAQGHAPIVGSVDVKVSAHPDVLRLLLEGRWAEAKGWCDHNHGVLQAEGFRRDGIKLVAGPSWLQPFDEGFGQNQVRK